MPSAIDRNRTDLSHNPPGAPTGRRRTSSGTRDRRITIGRLSEGSWLDSGHDATNSTAGRLELRHA